MGVHRSPVHPAGASAFGVQDLVGNGWEWTRTEFGPFQGFAPYPFYPGYSANFFDGKHYVLKGASWATADELVRHRSERATVGNLALDALGNQPERVIATKADSALSRPLCPYPQEARYSGQGSVDDAANFTCRQ